MGRLFSDGGAVPLCPRLIQPRKAIALVTGGSRGIGRAIVLELARAGWTVAFSYRGNEQAAAEVSQALIDAGHPGLRIQADIASEADRERLINAVLEAFGGIDLLVNNAGMAPRQRTDLLELAAPSYDEVMGTNLKGPFFLTQRVARVMVEQVRSGSSEPVPVIINIGSISAYTSSSQPRRVLPFEGRAGHADRPVRRPAG